MENRIKEIIQYMYSLLNDVSITPHIPDDLHEIEGIKEIDDTIRNIRDSIKSIGNGDLSYQINGNGYLVGRIKSLQATLRNLIWQTKAISSGDFSQHVLFLGEFSDAFNGMVKKLESNIKEVEETKALFELFFEMIPDATVILSYEDLNIFDCNQRFEKITRYYKEELYGKSIKGIRFFKDINQEKLFIEAVRGNESPQNVSLELDIHIDSFFQGLFSSSIIYIKGEKYILSVIKDVTEFKRLEKKLKDSEEVHRLLADNVSDVIWTMDLTGKFTYISPSVQKLRGYSVEEVMAQSKEELLCPSSIVYLDKGIEDAIYSVQNNLPFKVFRGDIEQPCKDGTTVWTDLTVSGIYDKNSQFLGMVGVSRDITKRKNAEEQIRRLTETDALTHLYNRFKLDYVIKTEIERSSRSNSSFVLIMLDIDNFKMVNDTYGHIAGDEVLQDFAGIIKNSIRKIDCAGRWGGEEFMIILPESNISGGLILAEKLRGKIAEYEFSNVNHLSASFGVAEFNNGINEIELVSRADIALYNAKKLGKNRVCSYE